MEKQTVLTVLFSLVFTTLITVQPVWAYVEGDIAADFTRPEYWTNSDMSLYSDFSGYIVLLEFFFADCIYCTIFSPEVEQNIQEYYDAQGGNPDGIPVKVISMNIVCNDKTDTDNFITNHGLDTVLNDCGGGLFYQYGGSGTPHFALINGAAGTNYDQWEILDIQTAYPGYQAFRNIIDAVTLSGALGDLQITLEPAEAIADGVQWNVDGGEWKNSGATVINLPAGTHTVNYKDPNNLWLTPPSELVTIQEAQTTQVTQTYRRTDMNYDGHVDILDLAILCSKWQLAGTYQEDLDYSGGVYLNDLWVLSKDWLETDFVVVDGFETGNFSQAGWGHAGTSWAVVSNEAFAGSYSAKSGAISHNGISVLTLTLDCTGFDEIRFARKVSTEGGYDFLRFFIDGPKVGEWSGEQDWTLQSHPVTSGSHTFTWLYQKDGSGSGGSDSVWIDHITLVPTP